MRMRIPRPKPGGGASPALVRSIQYPPRPYLGTRLGRLPPLAYQSQSRMVRIPTRHMTVLTRRGNRGDPRGRGSAGVSRGAAAAWSRGGPNITGVEEMKYQPGPKKTMMKQTLGTPLLSTRNPRHGHSRGRAHVPEPRRPGVSPMNRMAQCQRSHPWRTCAIDSNLATLAGSATSPTAESPDGDAAKAMRIPHRLPSGMYCHPSLGAATPAHHTGSGRPRKVTTTPRSCRWRGLAAITRRPRR